jgi:hypothetical protein
MTEDANVLNQGIDARTFLRPIAELADTIGNKLDREGAQMITPYYVAGDIFAMVRQVLKVYELFFYINADARRSDASWHIGFPAALLPVLRTMIDCLYNVTTILDDPAVNGKYFRASGYGQMLESIAEDEKTYGGSKEWDAHNAERRKIVDLDMRAFGFTATEAAASPYWLTLSRYLKKKPPPPNAVFLEQLTLGFWREYSAISHSTFNGLVPTAMFFTPRKVEPEVQKFFDEHSVRVFSLHLLRVVGILLCILTEIQAKFRFDGAHINERLVKGWDAVDAALEIKRLRDLRYNQLMKDSGITA